MLFQSRFGGQGCLTASDGVCFPAAPQSRGKKARGSISRVLSSGSLRLCGHSSRGRIAPPLKQPTRATSRNKTHMPPLFGFAPGGVYRAAFRCRRRGALLPHPFALTCPKTGGLLSVALSLGQKSLSGPPGVTRHRCSVEPGLSSPPHKRSRGCPTLWPPLLSDSSLPVQ